MATPTAPEERDARARDLDLAAFTHLRHLISYHGPVTLSADYDESGETLFIEIAGSRQSSIDLMELILNEASYPCYDHVATCRTRTIAEEGYCAYPYCHGEIALLA